MLYSEYETTVVMKPEIGGDAIESTLDRIRSAVDKEGGKLLAIKHWGKKRLAYEMQKRNRGVYVHTQYLGKDMLVAEIERNLRISDNVMRFLTVCVSDGVKDTEREIEAYVKPEYDVEEPSRDSDDDMHAASDDTSDDDDDVGDDDDATDVDDDSDEDSDR